MRHAMLGELLGSQDFGDTFLVGEEVLKAFAVGLGSPRIRAIDETGAAFWNDMNLGFADLAAGSGLEQPLLPQNDIGTNCLRGQREAVIGNDEDRAVVTDAGAVERFQNA